MTKPSIVVCLELHVILLLCEKRVPSPYSGETPRPNVKPQSAGATSWTCGSTKKPGSSGSHLNVLPSRVTLMRPRGCSVTKPTCTVRFVMSSKVAGLMELAEPSSPLPIKAPPYDVPMAVGS